MVPKRNLPRLHPDRYRGHAIVFWTLTFHQRSTGWLTSGFHARFRELLLHAGCRESLWCPAYVLMPDHLHLLWMGMDGTSDQLNGIRFLRKETQSLLGGRPRWQHQAHDHVLREEERRRDAFASVCFYILQNPVRGGLVREGTDWGFSGCVVPGYPRLHPLSDGFWDRFWMLHNRALSEPDAVSGQPQ